VDTGGGVVRRVLLQYSVELDERAGHIVAVLWQVPRLGLAWLSQGTAHSALCSA
jgi:hypothetical protein